MSEVTYDQEKQIEKNMKDEVLSLLTRRHDLYMAHWAYREKLLSQNPQIDFYIPFRSPVQIYVETNAVRHGSEPWQFDSVLNELLRDRKLARVMKETYCFAIPNDFRDARIGDLFLNRPILLLAYHKSASDTESGQFSHPAY